MSVPSTCPQCGAPLQVLYTGPEHKDKWLNCEHCHWKKDLPEFDNQGPGQFHEHVEEITQADGTVIKRIVRTNVRESQIIVGDHFVDDHNNVYQADELIMRVRQEFGDEAAADVERQLAQIPPGWGEEFKPIMVHSENELDDIPGLSEAERQEIAEQLHVANRKKSGHIHYEDGELSSSGGCGIALIFILFLAAAFIFGLMF